MFYNVETVFETDPIGFLVERFEVRILQLSHAKNFRRSL